MVGEVKARAPIAAVLAAPTRGAIYYGTNAGDLFAVALTPEKIGPQKKLAEFGPADG